MVYEEFYITYTSSVISNSVTGTLIVSASAINFLLISDGLNRVFHCFFLYFRKLKNNVKQQLDRNRQLPIKSICKLNWVNSVSILNI
jgi:hypothetical protein